MFFVNIYSKDQVLYRSHSLNNFAVCDTIVFEDQITLERCIGIIDEHDYVYQDIVQACNIKDQFLNTDNEIGEAIHFGDESLSLLQINKKQEGQNKWLLLPIFSCLFLLLVQPFKEFNFKKSKLNFAAIAGAMLIYQLAPFMGDDKIQWQLPASMFTLFLGLYFWRNEHRLNISDPSKRLLLHWALILFTFLLGLYGIKTYPTIADTNNPFDTFNKIGWNEIYLFGSAISLLFIHLVSLHQHSIFSKRNFKEGKKHFILQACLGMLHLGMFMVAIDNFPVIPVVLSLTIYFLLIDLFSEGKQNPVIWSILWTVFMSVIIAGTIYHFNFSNTIEQVYEKIAQANFSSEEATASDFQSYDYTNIPGYYKDQVDSYTNSGIDHFFKDKQIHFINHLNNGNVEILKYKIPGFAKAITMFSFVFLMGISFYFLLTLLHQKLSILPRALYPGEIYLSSFSRRIQSSYLILTIISFVGIATITIFLLNNYFKNNERENLKNNLNLIKSQMTYLVNNHEGETKVLVANLDKVMASNNLKIDLFNQQGKSISTDDKFVSQAVVQYLDNHQDGSLNEPLKNRGFNSYIYLDHPQHKYAFIQGIDKYSSASLSIYDFIAGILNVYVFLFIIAISFGLFVSKSIVDPLARLTRKMQELKLGKENQLIEWSGEGEVGSLIDNYNEMVLKLEQSASLIAHTERDMAWREMARQVAHEIKNPLTPMKLRVQFLQNQISAGKIPDNASLERISTTLLEQISNLSNISDAFSNVAKLPNASNEKVTLNEVVESVHDLFRKREDMHIRLNEPINDLLVFADKNHLVRILNNLVKNAIEAIPEDRIGEIDISLYKEDSNAVIRVTDNGLGIPKSMQAKIFTPKFTTKNSGSGLGLAIAQNMAESFNARLYFKSKEGQGTSFYLQIPLMRLVANKEGNRVMLD